MYPDRQLGETYLHPPSPPSSQSQAKSCGCFWRHSSHCLSRSIFNSAVTGGLLEAQTRCFLCCLRDYWSGKKWHLPPPSRPSWDTGQDPVLNVGHLVPRCSPWMTCNVVKWWKHVLNDWWTHQWPMAALVVWNDPGRWNVIFSLLSIQSVPGAQTACDARAETRHDLHPMRRKVTVILLDWACEVEFDDKSLRTEAVGEKDGHIYIYIFYIYHLYIESNCIRSVNHIYCVQFGENNLGNVHICIFWYPEFFLDWDLSIQPIKSWIKL